MTESASPSWPLARPGATVSTRQPLNQNSSKALWLLPEAEGEGYPQNLKISSPKDSF
jgi:hypothetical protein